MGYRRGVKAGETVVVEGTQKIKPGDVVNPQTYRRPTNFSLSFTLGKDVLFDEVTFDSLLTNAVTAFTTN